MITLTEENEYRITIKVGGLIHLIYNVPEDVVAMTKFRKDMIQRIPKDEETGMFHKVKEGNSKDYILQMFNEVYPSRKKK